MRVRQSLDEPLAAMPDVLGPGIGGTVGEPQRDIAAADDLGDLDAVGDVILGGLADIGIGVPERAVLIDLVLEDVGIDGSDAHAVLLGNLFGGGRVLQTVREIPQDVDGDGRAAAGELVHLAGIGELLFGAGGRGVLYELAEARSGIRKTPGWQLDQKRVERLHDCLGLPFRKHRRTSGLVLSSSHDSPCRRDACRDESRHGTHECVRHIPVNSRTRKGAVEVAQAFGIGGPGHDHEVVVIGAVHFPEGFGLGRGRV